MSDTYFMKNSHRMVNFSIINWKFMAKLVIFVFKLARNENRFFSKWSWFLFKCRIYLYFRPFSANMNGVCVFLMCFKMLVVCFIARFKCKFLSRTPQLLRTIKSILLQKRVKKILWRRSTLNISHMLHE